MIFITTGDGKKLKNIVSSPADDIGPDWSPDGKRITFESNRNGRITTQCYGAGDDCMYELFVIKPDGTGLRKLTTGWTFYPSWSPDGNQIVFLAAFKSEASPNPSDPFLYSVNIVNSDGTNLRSLTDSPGYYEESLWSPDGKKIAFHSGEMGTHPNSFNIINRDGTGLSSYPDMKGYDFVWGLDSNSLIIEARPENFSGNDLYRLKTDLSGIEQLTFTPDTFKDRFAKSPDGKWLAYHSQNSHTSCDQIRVLDLQTLKDYFVYDANAVGEIKSTEEEAPLPSSFSIQSIAWTPDSSQLIFQQGVDYASLFGTNVRAFIIQLDGMGLSYYSGPEGARQP